MRIPTMLLLLAVSGCGAPTQETPPDSGTSTQAKPVEGADCTSALNDGLFVVDLVGACTGSSSSLWCERTAPSRVWRYVPCKGPAGCVEGSNKVVCDTTGNVAGEKCLYSQEGSGACTSSTELLRCEAGVLVTHPCPNQCTQAGGQFSCS